MKKVLFTTLSIIAVAAMMFVSCKKDEPKPDNNKPEEQKVDEELVGTWTIVGEANGWKVDAGVAMTESDNVWTVAEVAIKGEGFKFVKDGSWDINLGAVPTKATQNFEDDVEIDLAKNGDNIAGAKDGIYSVTLNLLTKKAKIKFVKDLEPEGPNWAEFDYTPSDEYLAETNLWKAVDDANAAKFFSYLNPGWGQTPINDNVEADALDFLTKTQSTYELQFEKATDARWQNQFYIFPGAEANFVALDPAKKYRVKFSVTSTASFDAFFKLSQYVDAGPKHEGAAMWQPDGYTDEHPSTMTLVADTPLVLETELTGQDTKNVVFIFDFGFNPANTRVCIKDIIIEELPPSVSEFVALEDNAESTFEAIVAAVVPNKGIIVTDGAKNLYVFGPKTYPVVGDKVSIKATKTTYYGLIETKSGAEVTVLSQGNAVPATTPVDVTATFDAFPDAMATSEMVTVVGTIAVSGNFVNFNVNGATKRQGSAAVMDLKSYDGKTMAITGYYYGTSGSGGKFVNIAVTKAEVFEPTIDGSFEDWANISTGLTHTGGALVAFKVVKGAENLYFYAKRDMTRFADIWAANGYLYFCLDLDNNAETGDGTLWGNGPYEALMAIFPYAGTSEAPAFAFGSDTTIMPATFSLANAKLAGKVTDTVGVEVEISIPLADLPTIPTSEISIYTWGNKGADDAHQKWTGTL